MSNLLKLVDPMWELGGPANEELVPVACPALDTALAELEAEPLGLF